MATDISSALRRALLRCSQTDDVTPLVAADAFEILECIQNLRALLVDIDKSGLLEHRSECRRRMWNDEKCSCDFNALQDRINAATAAKEEPE